MTAVGCTIPGPDSRRITARHGLYVSRFRASALATAPPAAHAGRPGRHSSGRPRGQERGATPEPRCRSHGCSGGPPAPRAPHRLHARPHTPAGNAEEPPAPSLGRDGPRPANPRPAGTGEAVKQRVTRAAAPAQPRPALPAPPAATTQPPAPGHRLPPPSFFSPMLPAGPEGAAPAGARLGGCGCSSRTAGGRGAGRARRVPPRRCHGGGSAAGGAGP